MRRRVAITGAGTVNALARDVRGTWEALAAGRSGIGPLDIPDSDRLAIRIGARVRGWTAPDDPREAALYDRFTQFALAAAGEAVAQSGLDLSGNTGMSTGVILGTAGGGLETTDATYRAVYAEGRNRVHPLTVPRLMHNAAAAHVGMRYGASGPTFTVASACASSNHAMGIAFQMVRSGAAVAMLAGGSEAMLCFGGIKAWEGLRVLSPDSCRPFDLHRNGMVMGEGAGVFVFEDWDHAAARGAHVLAEVAGFGMTADAADIVLPAPEGAARAMRAALDDAGMAPEEVGYINAHGTGTRANDASECAAVWQVFGPHAARLALSSTKAAHGHAIGATGAIEMIGCLMALSGVLPPTLGHVTPDPHCALDVVPNLARRAEVGAVLTNAFAFGGLNAVLALRRAA